MRSIARPRYRTAKIGTEVPNTCRKHSLRWANADQIQYRRHPIDEQEEIQKAAEENDPQQHGLQGIPLAEQHPDRVAPRDVNGIALRRSDVEASEQGEVAR